MAFLTVRHPDDKMEEVPLSQEKELFIGRASTNDIKLPLDPKVSSRHCRIYFSPELGRFVLSDLRSTNGTILNLNRIAADVALSDKDRIKVGDTRLLFHAGELEIPGSPMSSTRKVLKLAATRDSAQALRTDTCVIPNFGNIKRKPKITVIDGFTLSTGETVGKYQVLRKLADFQYGSVYSALGPGYDSTPLALKIFSAAFDIHHPALDQFNNMMLKLVKLDNPYFVKNLDYGVQNGRCFFVMEFVAGEDLNNQIAVHAPYPEFEALSIVYTVADALSQAYDSNGVVHGMLSPASVVIDPAFKLILKGHGLAKWIMDNLSFGKPVQLSWYCSPEQALQKDFDFRTDIYSLGIILFHLLTGVAPFRANSDKETLELQARSPLPSPKLLNPNIRISSRTHALLARMTEKNPLERHRSWKDLLAEMEAASEELG